MLEALGDRAMGRRELTALSDQIVADGGTPWCAGIESGVATGWPITDWFEDFMLRLNGPDVYDQWVNHEIPFDDPEELMPVANDTNYGLAAGVFTRDISKAHRTAKRLRAGTVWFNTYHVFDAAMPFGGYKESGWEHSP